MEFLGFYAIVGSKLSLNNPDTTLVILVRQGKSKQCHKCPCENLHKQGPLYFISVFIFYDDCI